VVRDTSLDREGGRLDIPFLRRRPTSIARATAPALRSSSQFARELVDPPVACSPRSAVA